MNGKIAAIWSRVSTDDKQEPSLMSQVADVREWLEAQGWTVPPERIVTAHWTSKNILACPEMQRVLGWVRDREVGAVGLLHLDRFACRTGQMAQILEVFKDAGVEILAKNTPLPTGLMGEIMAFFITISKAMQVERADEGSKAGLHARAKLRGLPTTCQASYGYNWDETRTKLIANEHHEIRRLIISMYLDGATLKAVVKELKKRGIPSPSGKHYWNEATIANILKDTINYGIYTALRRESVEPVSRKGNTYGKSSSKHVQGIILPNIGVERPVTDKPKYDYIQERLAQNRLTAKRNGKRDYLLRSMIHFEGDNLHYFGFDIRHKSWAYRYYHRGKNGNPRCYLPGRKTEAQVEAKAREILTSNDVLERELGWREAAIQESTSKLEDEKKRLDRKHNENINLETVWVDLKAQGKVSDEAFERKRVLLSAEKTWIYEERLRIDQRLANLQQQAISLVGLDQLRQKMSEKLSSDTFADRRFILEALQTKVIVTTEGAVEVEFTVGGNKDSSSIVLNSPLNACPRY